MIQLGAFLRFLVHLINRFLENDYLRLYSNCGFYRCKGFRNNVNKNEIKNIIKVIKFLENRGFFLKGTTKKVTSQKGGFLNFLKPLTSDALLLMKNEFTPLTKSILVPLGLTAAASATDAAIQIKIYESGRPSFLASRTVTLVFSNEDLHENS